MAQLARRSVGRPFVPDGRNSPEKRLQRAILDEYCEVEHVRLLEIARHHNVDRNYIRRLIDEGDWVHIRRQRRQFRAALKKLTHPMEFLSELAAFIERTHRRIENREIDGRMGKDLVEYARTATKAMIELYEELGIKWRDRSNKISMIQQLPEAD